MLGENIMHGASQSERFVVGFLGISFSFSRFVTLPVGLAFKRLLTEENVACTQAKEKAEANKSIIVHFVQNKPRKMNAFHFPLKILYSETNM